MTTATDKKKADAKQSNIPDTTAVPLGEDVQKIAIVSGTDQPVDKQKTQEQIDIDRRQSESRDENSLDARLAESGFLFIDDPLSRKRYVARVEDGQTSVHGTPFSVLNKMPLSAHRPEAGLTVYVDDETSFTIPAGVSDWAAVVNPETGEPIIPGVTKAEAKRRKAA